ncbi:ABC transporter substrate-binding protein [Desertimonas flava]|uniref:ABC transporter substrate-binding protein n=1 Tax=Desertimonas flava TaxID=2064846 RepID=UPI000E350131|nr:ABC transporter substrate-binding protein [Desertimonas flava]
MNRSIKIATLVVATLGFAAPHAAASSPPSDSGTPDDTAAATPPERIVSLSPAATEVLFAIGAGDQVVAVDNYSNFPATAPITELSAFEPNIEAIADYEPDLVVVDATNPELITTLTELGIEVHEAPAPADLDGLYAEIEQLGDATGHRDESDVLVADMRTEIDEILTRVPETDEPLTFYHELDVMLYTVSSNTFIGQLYALAGLENVADAADSSLSSDYPQLSAEFLIDADPDLVFLANTKCCGENAETFGARSGFEAMAAVRNGNVVLLDDDIASRPGPRVVELFATIVDAVVVAVDEELAAA